MSSPPIAGVVLGQADLLHDGINNPTAAALQAPDGVAIDSSGGLNRLYVADTSNNRVLGWANAAAFVNGSPADIVIGQPDARSVGCNDGVAVGDSSGVGADSLCNPMGVAVDSSGHLYVADANDNRVLEYLTPFAISSPISDKAPIACWDKRQLSRPPLQPRHQHYQQLVDVLSRRSDGRYGGQICTFPTPATIACSSSISRCDANLIRRGRYGRRQGLRTRRNFHHRALQRRRRAPNADTLCDPRGLITDSSGDLFVADRDNSRCSNSINRWRRSIRSPARAIRPRIAFSARAVAARVSRPRYAPARPRPPRRVPPASAIPTASASTLLATCSSPTRSTIACSNTTIRWRRSTPPVATATSPRTSSSDKVRPATISSQQRMPTPPPETRRQARLRCAIRSGVAMDSAGNLYVADETNNRVLRFDHPIVPFTGPTPTASATATGSTPTTTATATATASRTATATQTASRHCHRDDVDRPRPPPPTPAALRRRLPPRRALQPRRLTAYRHDHRDSTATPTCRRLRPALRRRRRP